ncbi:MAG: hypothetical protein WBA12_12320 [Catalinimonas sp.]
MNARRGGGGALTSALLLLWLMLLPVACRKAVPAAEADRIRTEARTLRDSADAAWTAMMASDDAKIDNLGRFLQELSYSDSVNVITLEGLRARHAALRDQRYDQNTMADAEIDRYDAATDALLRDAYALAANTPGFERFLAGEQLAREIKAADDSIIYYRVRYDQQAARYNEHLEAHAAQLEGGADPLPVFTLSE